ncbi:hypothetical protein HELRODRAFT_176887 [Helobdella robusta]|uniref:Mitochondrial splicing suppressor 51-like C-terminal domain-containing protein n=1 Tax=Helobdella robusta TaxID=6412 RepID=T1FB07_HELRO|nr:hypothetical protein HELRODRAFT_176887 [Helobdella robusta]ESN98420.1 hypothetical protein HELRODRAFT_176887 [Helobdella robusta]
MNVELSTEFSMENESPVTSWDQTVRPYVQLENWKGFFNFKNLLPENSGDVSKKYHWVMTAYFILRHFLQTEVITTGSLTLNVHFVGVETEIQYIHTFNELLNLFPSFKFQLSFIGPNMQHNSSITDNAQTTKILDTNGKIEVKFIYQLYHDIVGIDKPDLVIGFNAGISAYPSWKTTILHLKKNKIPSYFSEYCWRCYYTTRNVLHGHLRGVHVSNGLPNNFRCPTQIRDDCTKITQYRNNIVFKLLFHHPE